MFLTGSALRKKTATQTPQESGWIELQYPRNSTNNVTKHEVRYLGGGAREQVTNLPNGTKQIDEYSYGKLITSTMEESGSSTQISSVTYGYDALGRVSYETDARNGTTYYTYNSQGQVTRVDYPSGGPVVPSHSELEYEDNTGLLISETQPDGGVKRYKYNKKGEKVCEYGTRTNPVKYEYDAQGRMIKMWTYKDFSGDPDSPGT